MEAEWAERDGSTVLVVRAPAGTALPRIVPADVLGRRQVAMAGRWRTEGDAAVFVPRFPFVPATSYALVLDDGPPLLLHLPAPTVLQSTTTVLAIEPALRELPRNLLRFVVTFSAPMSEGHAARCLRLESASGQPFPGVFLGDPELWDAERRRLTVLLDPARIKRGLRPHLEAGYPLAEGDEVRLVVDAGWPDARGRPLRAGAEVSYRVGPDLRGRVRPETWHVTAPPAGTREALRVEFGRPLDRRLPTRRIRLLGISGVGSGDPDGRGWSFVPAQPWPTDDVRIVVDPSLEDVAGNSVARAFDRDLSDRDDDPLDSQEAIVLTAVVRERQAEA